MKMKLRPGLSIERNGEAILGPCEIEISETELAMNAHKFESIQQESEPKSKKGKDKEKAE